MPFISRALCGGRPVRGGHPLVCQFVGRGSRAKRARPAALRWSARIVWWWSRCAPAGVVSASGTLGRSPHRSPLLQRLDRPHAGPVTSPL